MARNKKKSRATTHAQSCSDEEREEDHDTAPTTMPAADAEGGEGGTGVSAAAECAAATFRQHSDRGSERGSDSDSDDRKKRKKEYRGNRLKKLDSQLKKNKGKGANEDGKAEEAVAEGDGEGEPLLVTRQKAVEVLYCPICTFPAEMCEFSGVMEKCRPWLQEHAADLADAEERGRRRRILTEKDRLEALLEGRGIKKALERIVVLDVEKRTGRRMITSVFGMDLFGFNLKDVSREWRKRFSCGAGVRAAEEGKHQDCIDIQGNLVDQLAEMLVTKYAIPKESVYIMEGKKRVPYLY
ncbi:hypothetical protein LSCM1_05237 [Leishmania martiniquensis]|uniref:SUI1 domain-containing protein n=1 Tax=Leishmania martiniquensis TaxID=1580590 RepID=A0A836HHE7_9TRYP|nr:hypothetical protein LSCM1_05237 [Leishmania martiniquensis]